MHLHYLVLLSELRSHLPNLNIKLFSISYFVMLFKNNHFSEQYHSNYSVDPNPNPLRQWVQTLIPYRAWGVRHGTQVQGLGGATGAARGWRVWVRASGICNFLRVWHEGEGQWGDDRPGHTWQGAVAPWGCGRELPLLGMPERGDRATGAQQAHATCRGHDRRHMLHASASTVPFLVFRSEGG